MPQPPHNNTSWVEDLDPEPAPRNGLRERRELMLGLFVLLAVLGWAGWQWIAQARDENEYILGEQALRANNLEEAESHFGAISDYKDAGSRARELAGKIGERDSWYRDLTTGYQSGNWLQAYDAAQKLNKVPPLESYVQTLLETSREHIYTEALSGTLLSRVDADPPGLYYRAGDKWIWLEGSDAASRVLGTGPPGHMVYDVPATDQARTLRKQPHYGLAGSKLMLATFAPDGLTFQTLSLDPHYFYYFIWGDHGVWGLRDKLTLGERQVDGPSTFYAGYEIAYEAYGSPLISDMKPKGSGWVVIDFAPDGKQILLADVSKVNSSHPWIGLYAAGGDGTGLRLLYSFDGKFQRAIFSPDSRYVLLTTFSPFDYDLAAGKQTVMLLDTAGAHPPRILAEATRNYSSYLDSSLASTFLQSGPYTGQILLLDSSANQNASIGVIDPDTASQAIPKLTIQADLRRARYAGAAEVTNDHGLILVLQGTPDRGDPYLIFVRDSKSSGESDNHPDSLPTLDWERMDLHEGDNLQGLWLSSNGNLAYMVAKQRSGDPTQQNNLTVYSDKLLWADTSTPQHLTSILYSAPNYQTGNQSSSSFSSGPLSIGSGVVAGSDMVAYCPSESDDPGHLQVKSYDGTTSVTIADKGCRLYDWSQYMVFRGLR